MKLPFSDLKFIPNLLFAFLGVLLFFYQPDDKRPGSIESLDSTIIRKTVPDSTVTIINCKKQQLRLSGPSNYLLFAGVTMMQYDCDTLAKKTGDIYYISLGGYAIRSNTSFYINGNEYLLEKNGEIQKTGVRLTHPGHNGKGVNVLVPVSFGNFELLQYLFFFGILGAFTAWLLFFYRYPVRVMINISKGQPFIKQNITYLNYTGWAVIITCLAATIIPTLIRLCLSSRIPAAIYYPFWSAFMDMKWGIFIGILVLMLAKAFRRGYKITVDKKEII
jgi:hypothetical protein